MATASIAVSMGMTIWAAPRASARPAASSSTRRWSATAGRMPSTPASAPVRTTPGRHAAGYGRALCDDGGGVLDPRGLIREIYPYTPDPGAGDQRKETP